MLHTVGTDNYGWCSKEAMFQCDVKVILVHGPLQKYRGLFLSVRCTWSGTLVSKTRIRNNQGVRIPPPMPNTGIRKVWLIRLLWEQKIASSNLASPTNFLFDRVRIICYSSETKYKQSLFTCMLEMGVARFDSVRGWVDLDIKPAGARCFEDRLTYL